MGVQRGRRSYRVMHQPDIGDRPDAAWNRGDYHPRIIGMPVARDGGGVASEREP